jgi:hypothetical protein
LHGEHLRRLPAGFNLSRSGTEQYARSPVLAHRLLYAPRGGFCIPVVDVKTKVKTGPGGSTPQNLRAPFAFAVGAGVMHSVVLTQPGAVAHFLHLRDMTLNKIPLHARQLVR